MTSPYGETKLAFEHALKWYEGAYGFRYVSWCATSTRPGADPRATASSTIPRRTLIPIVL